MPDFERDIVHLGRLIADGSADDVTVLLRRTLRRVVRQRPDLAAESKDVLARLSGHSATRAATAPVMAEPVPVDNESRLPLLRDEVVHAPERPPVWSPEVEAVLARVIKEREHEDELIAGGATPTRTLLLVGQPGVGKTYAARWLAWKLGRRLLTLDLAAVMSSLLGRTGTNVRTVLNYARDVPSVLLLDEFDAIAKKRGDVTDVGELKRLVTVLLQAVDDWPAHGLLIAATNHPELLDAAVWRRFEEVVEMPVPTVVELEVLAQQHLGNETDPELPGLLARLLAGGSFAEFERVAMHAKRSAILERLPFSEAFIRYATTDLKLADTQRRLDVASYLLEAGHSQRSVSELTGLSRDTIRKHLGRNGKRRRNSG